MEQQAKKQKPKLTGLKVGIKVVSIIFLVLSIFIIIDGILMLSRNGTLPFAQGNEVAWGAFFMVDGIIELIVCSILLAYIHKPDNMTRYLVVGIIGCCIISVAGILSVVYYAKNKKKAVK